MKRKYWWIFGVIQFAGVMATVEAYYLEDGILWLVSLLTLLPGSLASIPIFMIHGYNRWNPFLTVGIVAVSANILLFTTTSSLITRRQKPS
ncbi:MAG TPA: hypothetical protein VIH76_10825 [Candidatus Acidoferrales bacterium]